MWFYMYVYTPEDGQKDRNIQCNHLLTDGQNITYCAMVQKPWLLNSTWHNLKMFTNMSGNSSKEYKWSSWANLENCEIQQMLVIWKLLLSCVLYKLLKIKVYKSTGSSLVLYVNFIVTEREHKIASVRQHSAYKCI